MYVSHCNPFCEKEVEGNTKLQICIPYMKSYLLSNVQLVESVIRYSNRSTTEMYEYVIEHELQGGIHFLREHKEKGKTFKILTFKFEFVLLQY